MAFSVHKFIRTIHFIENENKEEHGFCYYASMFLWRIVMAILSGIFLYFFLNFLINISVILSSGKSIGEEDKFNITFAILFAIIFTSLFFFFLLLGFFELKSMVGAIRVRGTTDHEIHYTTLSEQLAQEQWQRSIG